MPSSYTSLLGFVLPVTGELSGTWGTTVNAQLTQLIEDSVANCATASVLTGNWTLSTTASGASNEARMMILIPTGAPGVSRDIYAPKLSKLYVVMNRSDAAVVLRGGPGTPTTGVTIPAGQYALCAWDTSISDFLIVGVGNSGTWALNTSGNAATATLATKSTNIAGGLVGQIPYQTAANTTALLAAGTAGQVLTSQGAAAPVWAAVSSVTSAPAVRQTVLSGPVDSNGFSAFGGSTGTATITTSGTLVATVAAGGNDNRTGSITNAAFTSPGGSGTGYMCLSIDSVGTVTASVRTLPFVYQWGGTYSVTNGQVTFNIQEMTAKVGNGATAAQVYEVCIGECPYTAGAWSGSIIWYALMGRYISADTAVPSVNTTTIFSSNLGSIFGVKTRLQLVNYISDGGYAVGEVVDNMFAQWNQSTYIDALPATFLYGTNGVGVVTGNTNSGAGFAVPNRNATIGSFISITNTSWRLRVIAERGW